MPVLRERKIPSELISTWKEKGSCVSVGMEIWFLRARRLQVGIIEGVDAGNNSIKVVKKDGMTETINPMERVLFVKPNYKIPKP